MTTFLEAALRLARAGYRVFPLIANGKTPALKEWQTIATTDPAKVRAWWSNRSYADCNIGVATGDGLVVVDCDTKPPSAKWPDGRHGLDSLALLDALDLPHGMRVATPGNGIHVYLATTEERFNSVDALKAFPGIDIRGDGGYVVGPGSVIDGVPYRVVN